MDADVIVVGAGPTGLMLAVELRRAGVEVLVLERHPRIREVAKAGGLSGQVLDLLELRGDLPRFEAASTAPRPAPNFPWGGMHVDLSRLPDPPMAALPLPQPLLEEVLDGFARELGAEVRRGHEVVDLSQDEDGVDIEVRGPAGRRRLRAAYVVGCDGARSRVRELVGIEFPGTTYPEVHRLASTTMPESVTLLDGGDLEVAGVGRIGFGFTRTERGEFAAGSAQPGVLGVFTSEPDTGAYDDDEAMTVAEVRASVRRVLGIDLPMGEPIRLTRFTFHARQAERYREGRVLLAGDAAHLFPAPGAALNVDLLDAVNLGWKLGAEVAGWAPAGLLDSYGEERRLAAERTMLHTQAQVALRRGHDPAAQALRALVGELLADEQPLHRLGSLMAGTDVRYPVPGQERHPLVGAFVPALAPHAAPGAAGGAGGAVRIGARPVLLLLADRPELRGIARGWEHRVDVRASYVADRSVDALLVRPDAHVAWAAGSDEPADTAAGELRTALTRWFGPPAGGAGPLRRAASGTARTDGP
ncbi:FAD-dependent oxidoreductase [Nocardioides sp. dk4132]|uniref:FAD-dependent oxidoreductase n=1 Tax=unclassified Nocardioides TaxID=2615069 RepID=UPI00129747AE|nr:MULTISPECIES: FAD-dependent oxidoreductase [unclassified Nocardioides]MQW76071.1 FAD-dependent oxidoreductase [Nocardioides sp. dk4132]QGA08919.1 FAD-dependent oxidoreductase [Nocardioides sp. dk884]